MCLNWTLKILRIILVNYVDMNQRWFVFAGDMHLGATAYNELISCLEIRVGRSAIYMI